MLALATAAVLTPATLITSGHRNRRNMHAQATVANVRSLVLALQAIKTPHKLPCAVTFEAGLGLSLRFLDSAHTMQSGFSLSPAVSRT